MKHDRIIGTHSGGEKGPLLICLAGIHGNEPAGVKALELIFSMLEVEPIANPQFSFRGRMIGLLGNKEAYATGERFIERDLNRIWTAKHIEQIKQVAPDSLRHEDRELRILIDIIEAEINNYQPERLIVLDLHTTTASGGIFSVASNDPESIRIAVELHAPVIKGMLRGIRGTTLHYFNRDHFSIPTVGVAFESGQHQDPLSVNRAIAAVTNCLRTIGCVRAEDVENRHDELLIEYSKNLPKVAELVMHHEIRPGDQFRMAPDFENFQPVKKGELLAHDVNGTIEAPTDARILMPLYQERGDDGFFLVREIDF